MRSNLENRTTICKGKRFESEFEIVVQLLRSKKPRASIKNKHSLGKSLDHKFSFVIVITEKRSKIFVL